MILPAIRGDHRAAGTYRWRPRGPLRTPIHTHIGLSDPRVSFDEAHAWRDHTASDFSLTTYPGDHFYLINQVTQVTRTISATLRRPVNSNLGR
jgi:surfactin synthase thioesterase subunit